MESFDDSSSDAGCSCGCCASCNPAASYDEPVYAEPEPFVAEPADAEPMGDEGDAVPFGPEPADAPMTAFEPLEDPADAYDGVPVEPSPVLEPTTMGDIAAIAATDPGAHFAPTTMSGFGAIDTASASTDVGITIFGGDTANNAAWHAANEEVARIAAVRNNFGNTPPNPTAAAEQALYPSVVLGQLRQLQESVEGDDD